MSYYYAEINRYNQTVMNFFCKRKEYEECLLEDDITPEQKSRRWTQWKDAQIHIIMEQFFWPKGKFVKWRIFDNVFGTEVCFSMRPDRHTVFFCNCFIEEFLKNYIYEEPGNNYLPSEIETLDVDLTGIDLFCHETM